MPLSKHGRIYSKKVQDTLWLLCFIWINLPGNYLPFLAGQGAAAAVIFCVQSLAGTPLYVTVTPLAPHTPGMNHWQRPLALIFIVDPAANRLASSRQLWDLFQLTQAESRLVMALMRGLTPEEFAHEANVSIATVRTHLRSAFSKTGARRQAELVKLLSGVVNIGVGE